MLGGPGFSRTLSRVSWRLFSPSRLFSKQADVISQAMSSIFSTSGGAGVLSSQIVAQLRAHTGYSEDELMLAMLPHARQAAVPQMSDFRVGSVALGLSGRIYLGFNLEFRGLLFQHTVHAEQSAIYLAADAGEKRLVKLATTTTPCGHCRQFMQELPFPHELQIICPKQSTNDTSPPVLGYSKSLEELLPEPFGPQDLGLYGTILQPPHHALETWASSLAEADWRHDHKELVDKALNAARRSYAPFGAPSGMAVRTQSGQVIGGFAVQSVAHNPGMTTAGPIQGVLVKLAASGCSDWRDISEAVLVETVTEEGRACHDYERQVSIALELLAPHAHLHVIRVTAKDPSHEP